ncbi:MAG: proton-conducting transporter membrane subunit [Phycisphaeraceae bacterium]
MNILILPLLIPFFTAMVLALCNGWRTLEKAISLLSCLAQTAFVFWLLFHVDKHGIQVVGIGGWAAPFGIAFVADRLSCIMLCLSMTVGTVVLVYTFWTVTQLQQRFFFYPLFQIVLLGVNWSFLTGDLFNLFVAYEVMLIGSYGMMMVGASKSQVRQTMKYIAINIVGSSLFVVGTGLIYATVGTLNMADIAQRTAALAQPQAGLVTAVSMLLLTVFALKAAAFPVFFWLPDSYPIVPLGINGFYAGLLTKVGVYSLLRVFVMVFQQPGHELALDILLWMSGFTMFLGVMGAMCQWEIRRILSWHIISQVGYMVMGIGLAANAAIAKLAIAGTIFYVVHHIVVKSCLFLVGGIAERVNGSQKLKEMGGVLNLAPGVAGLFLVAAFSLAGMPPFSGFLAKFVLVRAGLSGGAYFIVFVSIATSFLTLYSMSKIWSYAFWSKEPREQAGKNYRGMMAPTAVLVAITVVLGLAAQPFLELANRAAEDVIDPTRYIQAVLPQESDSAVATKAHLRGLQGWDQTALVQPAGGAP